MQNKRLGEKENGKKVLFFYLKETFTIYYKAVVYTSSFWMSYNAPS
jgi:hypothetical protein